MERNHSPLKNTLPRTKKVIVEMLPLAEMMRARRLMLRLNQSDVARRIGIGLARYNQWESATNVMGVPFLPKVAAALECHPADFFDDPVEVYARWQIKDAEEVIKSVKKQFTENVKSVERRLEAMHGRTDASPRKSEQSG